MDQQDLLSDQPLSDQPATSAASPAALPPLSATSDSGIAQSLDLLRDVPLRISVELGRARLLVRDVLALRTGSVIELDHRVGAEVDVLVNGTLIARGEVVVVDEHFGVRISEVLSSTPAQTT